MRITKRQLRRIIREVIEHENPRHIVDAETGEIIVDWQDPSYNEGGKPFSGMRADFEIWLAENPYVEAPPAIPASMRDEKTEDFYVEPKMRR